MKITVKNNQLSVSEYQTMRKSTGLDMLDNATIEKALKNDLHTVCISDNDKLIGMGRVVGDGAMYFYIQDIHCPARIPEKRYWEVNNGKH